MKKGFLILIPIIAFAAYMSRPEAVPTHYPGVPITAEKLLEEPNIIISPSEPIQGDPLLIQIEGTSTARSITFDKVAYPIFTQGGKVSALVGLDLRIRTGIHEAEAKLSDGTSVKKRVAIAARRMPSAPLGIPEKLGGNTPEAERELVSTLVEEAKVINAIPSTSAKLWSKPFRYPLDTAITITDPYGYSRETGGSNIAHKGTDFRAATGTPVYAVNDGKVAYVGYLRNYGNVIAVDHGAKVLSIYMHLSQVEKKVGEPVTRGEELARSGDTGYVLGPHLHLTIRIDNVSIDPMTFMSLVGEE